MKLAFAGVYRYASNAPTMEVTTEQMLDDAYLASRARLIPVTCAGRRTLVRATRSRAAPFTLTAADEGNCAVSFIQSNYMGFGSGCVEPHYGISLQNRGYGFSSERRQPQRGGAGQAALPHHHSGLPDQDGQPVMSYGVMGGNMQPQGHMQTLVRMLDYR